MLMLNWQKIGTWCGEKCDNPEMIQEKKKSGNSLIKK